MAQTPLIQKIIIIFFACLIALIGLVTVYLVRTIDTQTLPDETPLPVSESNESIPESASTELTLEQRQQLLDELSASSDATGLTTKERRELLSELETESSSTQTSDLTIEERQQLLDALQ